MHGTATHFRITDTDPKAERVATLSAEYLTADNTRRDAIGQEIAAIISGHVIPLREMQHNS